MAENWTRFSPTHMFLPHPESQKLWEQLTPIQQCAKLLAYHFADGKHLWLDMDGVVVQSNSFDITQVTNPHIIPALLKLESVGVAMGPATARGEKIIHFLRDQGLQFNGSGIIEDGQFKVQNGKIESLVDPAHTRFIADVQLAVQTHPQFRHNWDIVKSDFDRGIHTFAPGNEQWQGKNRISFWLRWHESPTQETLLIEIQDIFRRTAPVNGLDFDADIAMSVGRMDSESENLAFIGLKARKNKIAFNKQMAAQKLSDISPVFIADGVGDLKIAELVHARNGCVIGIREQHDINSEVAAFLEEADVCLENPEELAEALALTAIELGYSEAASLPTIQFMNQLLI